MSREDPGIQCARYGCLASVSWVGHPADELLEDWASERGWKRAGDDWFCPRHLPAASLRARAADKGEGDRG